MGCETIKWTLVYVGGVPSSLTITVFPAVCRDLLGTHDSSDLGRLKNSNRGPTVGVTQIPKEGIRAQKHIFVCIVEGNAIRRVDVLTFQRSPRTFYKCCRSAALLCHHQAYQIRAHIYHHLGADTFSIQCRW